MPQLEIQPPTYIKLLLAVIAAGLALLVALYLWLMLQWPMMREGHYLHYIGYLINEHHFAPYRDIFETSWFGTFLFHVWVGKIFGYSALAFRTADVVWLTLLLVMTWQILRRLSPWLAPVAALTFALAYLHFGPANTLQRDYIILVPVSAAILLSLQQHCSVSLRAFGIGALFGMAATVKPHTVIGMPVVIAILYSLTFARDNSLIRLLIPAGFGGLFVFALGFCWLWYRDGLQGFLDMTLHYLPLYQTFNGAHHTIEPAQHLQDTLKWWKHFTWLWPWTIAAGLWRGWTCTSPGTPQRALVWALPALALCYNLYPLPAGKFWDYHWIPYSYFAILSSALLLIPSPRAGRREEVLSLACLLLFLSIVNSQYMPWGGLQNQLKTYPDITVSTAYDDEIAAFIRQHTPPGGTVPTCDQGGPPPHCL